MSTVLNTKHPNTRQLEVVYADPAHLNLYAFIFKFI